MSKKGIPYLLFVFICSHISTQAQVKDAGLWLSLAIEKKLTSKFALQLNEDLRFNENITELGTIFTELGAEYKIVKGLTCGLTYRFIQKRRVDDFYNMRHRYNIDVAYKIKIQKFSFTTRGRYQSMTEITNTDADSNVPKNYMRSKFTIKYDPGKKTTPFCSIEFFNRLNDRTGEAFVDNIRYQFGLDHDVNKFSSFTLSYLINKEVNVNNPWTDYIVNVGYKYSF